MSNTVHGEHKRRRHVLLTETAWTHLGNIAHDARLSNSEALERLVRSTLPGKEVQLLRTMRGRYAWTTPKRQSVHPISFLMKASDLALHLRTFLASNEDCEVKLFCEQVCFDDVFDADSCEEITDIRLLDDWPLPGESLIVGNSENPGKFLVLFYNAQQNVKR